jgi:hypothetical protein
MVHTLFILHEWQGTCSWCLPELEKNIGEWKFFRDGLLKRIEWYDEVEKGKR